MGFTSSPKGSAKVVKRSDSTHSLRRSVAGMKSLLPLKLSASLPNSISSSSASTKRSTFGFEQGYAKNAVLQTSNHSPSRQFNVPSSITIRRERYRDTPVYIEPGSPLLNLAYYTDEAVCLNLSSAASSCYQSFEYESEAGDSEGLDEETALRDQPRRMSRPSRSSGLSFQCLGESGGSLRTLNHDEGAWLSGPLKKWNHSEAELLPQILAESTPVEHDIEGWLSDTSSICEDDSYACATALAPARATVIEVTSSRFSVKIPPRSSSLVGTRTHSLCPSEEWNSRQTPEESLDYENWREEDFLNARKAWLSQPPSNNRVELPLPSPPLSPAKCDSSPRVYQGTDLTRESCSMPPYESTLSSPSGSNSISHLISALDDSLSRLPPTSLNPETPCITSIRRYLHQSSHHITSPWRIPALLPSPVLEGDNWQSQPYPARSSSRGKTSYLSSLRRTLSSRTSKTVPMPEPNCNHQMPDVLHTTIQQASEPLNGPREPDLQSFAAIFPNTTYELRSTLYAHILAHLLVSTIPQYAMSQEHTPPPSPDLHLPYYSTTSETIPRKAADRLGIQFSPMPRKINVGEDAIVLRHSGMDSGVRVLDENLRCRIGWLIAEMSEGSLQREKGSVDPLLLRTLGEVVKSSERDCFRHS